MMVAAVVPAAIINGASMGKTCDQQTEEEANRSYGRPLAEGSNAVGHTQRCAMRRALGRPRVDPLASSLQRLP